MNFAPFSGRGRSSQACGNCAHQLDDGQTSLRPVARKASETASLFAICAATAGLRQWRYLVRVIGRRRRRANQSGLCARVPSDKVVRHDPYDGVRRLQVVEVDFGGVYGDL
jgi:hypothetical protein